MEEAVYSSKEGASSLVAQNNTKEEEGKLSRSARNIENRTSKEAKG
jgi:hypothetical protein